MLTLKLKEDIDVAACEALLAEANPWVRLVPNQREASLRQLSPLAVSGTLDVAVGRVKKLRFDPQMFSLFTVADQLLWGAAEPLRRMLQLLVKASV